jgi:hypothetical protein
MAEWLNAAVLKSKSLASNTFPQVSARAERYWVPGQVGVNRYALCEQTVSKNWICSREGKFSLGPAGFEVSQSGPGLYRLMLVSSITIRFSGHFGSDPILTKTTLFGLVC